MDNQIWVIKEWVIKWNIKAIKLVDENSIHYRAI